MNDWLLGRFYELRHELLAVGMFAAWCRELRSMVAPDGALSLIEVIDTTTPELWQEAVERVKGGRVTQLTLVAGVSGGE